MAKKGSENLVICLHCEVPMSKVINYQLLQCSSPLTDGDYTAPAQRECVFTVSMNIKSDSQHRYSYEVAHLSPIYLYILVVMSPGSNMGQITSPKVSKSTYKSINIQLLFLHLKNTNCQLHFIPPLFRGGFHMFPRLLKKPKTVQNIVYELMCLPLETASSSRLYHVKHQWCQLCQWLWALNVHIWLLQLELVWPLKRAAAYGHTDQHS